MAYPVSVTVEPLLAPRNKMTTAFRLVLAIPHLFLVGGIGFSMVFRTGRDDVISLGPETGLLGFVAGVLAIVSWFTILISREHIAGIRAYTTLLPPLARARALLSDAAARIDIRRSATRRIPRR